ncbi:MAG: hypothetical protein ACI35W_04090 [Anaeroplasmataceae bacterium]
MKFYALHTRTTITGGSRAGVLELVLEPVFYEKFEDAKPRVIQQANNEIYSYNTIIKTCFFKTLDETIEYIKHFYPNDSYVDVENKALVGLEQIPFTKEEIRAVMHLYQTTYSMALLRLLAEKNPDPIREHFKVDNNFNVFLSIQKKKDYSYYELVSKKMGGLFKSVALFYEIPIETFVCCEEDFYLKESKMSELVSAYLKLNGTKILKKFEGYKGDEKNYLIIRYAAVNCACMIHDNTPTGVGNNIGVSKQIVSKYLLEPFSSSVSKTIKAKLNNEFIVLKEDVKDYL